MSSSASSGASRDDETSDMTSYPRYAIYYVPAATDPLYRLGAEVLGYDGFTGDTVDFPAELRRLTDWQEVTTDPRKYGFHATLKAPFALAPGCTEADLRKALAAFTAPMTPKIPLVVSSISSFIAVIPVAPSAELSVLAQTCVEVFDQFRAPLTDHDRARRRPERLTDRQRAYLDRWGYPYVAEEFQFHMTLTGSLPRERHEVLVPTLKSMFAAIIAEPRVIDRIALFYQADATSRFRVVAERELSPR
jgi:putative phosphonate metabolism protein